MSSSWHGQPSSGRGGGGQRHSAYSEPPFSTHQQHYQHPQHHLRHFSPENHMEMDTIEAHIYLDAEEESPVRWRNNNGSYPSKKKEKHVQEAYFAGNKGKEDGGWPRDRRARAHFFSVLTWMYAMLVSVYMFIIESSYAEKAVDAAIFHYYMFVVALLFLLYCYLFLLHPAWFNGIVKLLHKFGRIRNFEDWYIEPARLSGHAMSTMYMRMGTMVFCCAGVVLYGLEAFLIFEGHHDGGARWQIELPEQFIAAIFAFLQMHFMNLYFKLVVTSSHNICKFGFMHLVAVNIWTWFRFIIAKRHKKMAKQWEKLMISLNITTSPLEADVDDSFEVALLQAGAGYDYEVHTEQEMAESTMDPLELQLLLRSTTTDPTLYNNHVVALSYFGYFSGLMNTCLIEYSLIAAAVMFVFWLRVDPEQRPSGGLHKRRSALSRYTSKARRRMMVDCSSTAAGLFFGLCIFVLCCITMGVYTRFYHEHSPRAVLVLGVFELFILAVSLLVTIGGFLRMRALHFAPAHGGHDGETIDEILLFVGVMGELFHCCAEINLFANGVYDFSFVFFVSIIRILQVVSQTMFILFSMRLTLPFAGAHKFGRQAVTFLLVSNVTLFLFHIFESMTEHFGLEAKPGTAHAFIELLTDPIIVFYRFHSSVCMSEIWKKVYAAPHKEEDNSAATPMAVTTTRGHAVTANPTYANVY